MSVEQTTQLLQLVLNSVLLMAACVLLLGRVETRSSVINDRLLTLNRQWIDWMERGEGREPGKDNRLHSRKQVRQLQRRCQIVHYSLVSLYYALALSGISTLLLALKLLITVDWLIPLALGAFVIGVVVLLLGVGLTLFDLHTSDRALWEEVQGMLSLGRSEGMAKPSSRLRSLQVIERTSGAKSRSSRARVV